METFVLALVIAATIFCVGAAFGASLQDRVAEAQRRRAGRRHRELTATIHQLRQRVL